MKTSIVIALLVASISFVQCADYCYTGTCLATGAKCYRAGSPSASCSQCTNAFYACAASSLDTCGCAETFIQCAKTNATDDQVNCNPTILYQTCLSLTTNCTCGGAPQNTPIPTCNQGDFCNNSTHTCQAKTGANQVCYDDSDCQMVFGSAGYYTCSSGKCALVEYSVSIGDSCSQNDDCVNANYDEVSCVNSVCVGQNKGGNCTSSESCNFGLYCDNGLCAAELQVGDSCDQENDNCGYPAVCGYGSKCVKAFTVAKGSKCYADEECTPGNACVNGACAAPPAAKACSNNTDCPTSQGYTGTCDCDSNGKSMCSVESSLITSCYSQLTTYAQCVLDNNCPSGDIASPCVTKNCNNEANCYYNCALTANGSPSNCFPTLTCADSTGTTGSDASAVVASMGLAVAATAVLLA